MVTCAQRSKPIRIRGGIAGLGLALAVYACGLVAVPAAASATSVPSIDQVYARAARSLAQSGRVYHSVITPVGGAGDATTEEWWVDVRRDVARGQQQLRVGSPATHPILIVDGGSYEVPGHPDRALTCHGASASVGVVLGCPLPSEQSETTVRRAQYRGRLTIVLTTTGRRSAEDSETVFTRQLYLDPTTFLPFAAAENGTVDAGAIRHYKLLTRYRNGFIAASNLPTDFFSPKALGFTEPGSTDLLRTLPAGTIVYWLGATFTPGGDLPASTLSHVEPGSGSDYAAILYYSPASHRFGLPDLSVQVWPRAAWDDPHNHLNFSACPNNAPITLAGDGTATIYCDPNGPTAVVTYPDTVVLLGFRFYDNKGETVKPYASTDAITAVLHALTRIST
jgi:hypothetical protein